MDGLPDRAEIFAYFDDHQEDLKRRYSLERVAGLHNFVKLTANLRQPDSQTSST